MHFAVNWLAIIVATIAGFAVGAAWYITLGKQWMASIGKTRDQLDAGPVPYIIGILVEAVMAYFMALVILALFGEVTTCGTACSPAPTCGSASSSPP
jgi:hypothetical protein